MESSPQKVTKRIQKAISGNWGHPSKFEKRHTEIPDPMFPDEPRTHSVKKKKRVRKPYRSLGTYCPFCDTELPVDEKKKEADKKAGKWVADWLSDYRVKDCPNCKAFEVAQCPACKRHTWYDPQTKVYKHYPGYFSCGFIGLKKG